MLTNAYKYNYIWYVVYAFPYVHIECNQKTTYVHVHTYTIGYLRLKLVNINSFVSIQSEL